MEGIHGEYQIAVPLSFQHIHGYADPEHQREIEFIRLEVCIDKGIVAVQRFIYIVLNEHVLALHPARDRVRHSDSQY